MLRTLVRTAAWLVLAAIIFVTVSPIGWRPELGFGPTVDRFVGFLALGLVFGIGYGRRWPIVLMLLVVAAFGIEALQFLTPDRDPRLLDAIVKSIGAVAGIGVARLPVILLRRSGKLLPDAEGPV